MATTKNGGIPVPLCLATFSAPSNIAIVKYWGKRDAGPLNLPINSSVSVTMDQAELRAVTTVAAYTKSAVIDTDRLWLNGKEELLNTRVDTVLTEMRKRATRHGAAVLRIVSANSFPTAAGLASSAAGYAALVVTLAKVFGVPLTADLTTVARMGSGSACRSLYGGLVAWRRGSADHGRDSIAVQLAPKAAWLDITILVLNAAKKHTSSTDGMVRSVQTSSLLGFRAQSVVPDRLLAVSKAYKARDFEQFGKLMMQDSNQFHATCLDTYPPVFYLTDDSRKVIQLVHSLNAAAGRVCAAYTFDAGPNAVIFSQKKDTQTFLKHVRHFFPPAVTDASATPPPAPAPKGVGLDPCEVMRLKGVCPQPQLGVIQQIYHTRIGDGPREVAVSLLDPATALPKLGYQQMI